MLGGVCSVESSAGDWPRIGGRANVFGGVAHTLYLPIQTRFNLIAESACEFALCYCTARTAYPARLITPEVWKQLEDRVRRRLPGHLD